MKNKIYLFLRVLVSLTLVFILLWMMRGNLGHVVSTIKNADLALLVFSFLIYVLTIVLMGVRLRMVLLVQKINLTLKEVVYLCFLGLFFNNFLPTTFGGDLVKAYYAGKKCNRKSAAFTGVLMDRILAMLPFTFLPVCALIFTRDKIENPVIMYFILAVFAITIFVLLLLFNRRVASFFKFLIKPFTGKPVYQKIIKIYDSLNVYRHHKIILAWTFLISLSSQALFIVSVFISAKAIGINSIPCGVFFLLVPIVSVMGMLPSVNGLGIREAGFVYMFKSYVSTSVAFALSILALAMLIGVSIIGAFIYAFKKNLYSFKPENEGDLL
ncbi:MAG: lysylphosphatidylglycerol synthase transmembrane domain-containing protein [Candidatus Omnitrophota bacterium]